MYSMYANASNNTPFSLTLFVHDMKEVTPWRIFLIQDLWQGLIEILKSSSKVLCLNKGVAKSFTRISKLGFDSLQANKLLLENALKVGLVKLHVSFLFEGLFEWLFC